MQSSSQFRSAPPPALASAQYATEFNEVKSLGRATSSTRTDDQTYRAKWWQSAPILSWNEVARQLIARNGLDAADSARLLALQNLSGADAAINCWNDKYHFDFWRPWNAIPRALEDGNDATDPDATWAALITAPYPEWPSGHNCLDAAHVTVLRMFFGDAIQGGFQITSTFVNPGGPAVRTFDTFSQPLAELIEARIWAGLHYRSADVAGQVLGRNVANYGAANYFSRWVADLLTSPRARASREHGSPAAAPYVRTSPHTTPADLRNMRGRWCHALGRGKTPGCAVVLCSSANGAVLPAKLRHPNNRPRGASPLPIGGRHPSVRRIATTLHYGGSPLLDERSSRSGLNGFPHSVQARDPFSGGVLWANTIKSGPRVSASTRVGPKARLPGSVVRACTAPSPKAIPPDGRRRLVWTLAAAIDRPTRRGRRSVGEPM